MPLPRTLTAAAVAGTLLAAPATASGTGEDAGQVAPVAARQEAWRCSSTSPDVELDRLRTAFDRIHDTLPTVGISLIAKPAEELDGPDEPEPGPNDPAAGRRGQPNTEPVRITCGARGYRRVVSASTIKPLLVAEMFFQRQGADRWPSRTDRRLARAAIRVSDNGATSAIWRRTGGRGGLIRFARLAGLTLNAGYGTKWGLTRVSAVTLSTFSWKLLHPAGPVTPEAAAFVRRNMENVIPRQRWGISAGAPSGATIATKPGWLPFFRNQHVHAFGTIETRHATYALSVVSTGSASFTQGINRIERASRLVNRALRLTEWPPPPEPKPSKRAKTRR